MTIPLVRDIVKKGAIQYRNDIVERLTLEFCYKDTLIDAIETAIDDDLMSCVLVN